MRWRRSELLSGSSGGSGRFRFQYLPRLFNFGCGDLNFDATESVRPQPVQIDRLRIDECWVQIECLKFQTSPDWPRTMCCTPLWFSGWGITLFYRRVSSRWWP